MCVETLPAFEAFRQLSGGLFIDTYRHFIFAKKLFPGSWRVQFLNKNKVSEVSKVLPQQSTESSVPESGLARKYMVT
jgi:hypothetical protein